MGRRIVSLVISISDGTPLFGSGASRDALLVVPREVRPCVARASRHCRRHRRSRARQHGDTRSDPLAEDFTTWLQGAADGRIDLGALVTMVPPFTGVAIAEAFRAMLAGEVVRTVISFD